MNDTIKSSALNTYLKKLKKVCPRTVRSRLVSDLSDRLYDYLDRNPNATYKDFEQEFGAPEDFYSAYLNAMDDKELIQSVSKTKTTKNIILIIALALITMTIITGICIIYDNNKSVPTYYETGIEYDTTN